MAFDLSSIKLGQVLQIPGVKGIFEKFAPGVLSNPMAGLAENMPLTSVFDIISKTVGKKESGQVQEGLVSHLSNAAGAGGIGDLLGGLMGGGAKQEGAASGIAGMAGDLLGGLMGKKDAN